MEKDTEEAIKDWRATLSDRVRRGTLIGFIELGPDVGEQPPPADDKVSLYDFRYQTNRPTHRDFPQAGRPRP